MNAHLSLVGGTMPRFSTDPTALSVNCFIAHRTALTTRPDTGEEDDLRRATAPLEVLYPSLYGKRSTPPVRWRGYVRGDAFAFVTLSGRSSRAIPSDETMVPS